MGGSKQTVLEVRKEVIAKLMEDGHTIDPSAAFQAAADPLVRKLWSIGRQQAEASFARRVRDLGTINEGLELDVDALQESLEDAQHRADAEARLTEIMKNYDLRGAFQVLAASVRDGASRSGTARAPKPKQREIAGVLGVLERLSGPIAHERSMPRWRRTAGTRMPPRRGEVSRHGRQIGGTRYRAHG